MGVKEVIDVRKSSIRKQIDNVYEFVTTPKGIFQTLDEAVKTFRQANRDTLKAIGLTLPFMSRVRGMVRRR